MSIRSVALLSIIALLAARPHRSLSAVPPARPSAAAVLARVRAATLSRPLSSIRSIYSTGTFEAAGFRGRFEEWDDVRQERFVQRQSGAGPLDGANGWDGRHAWTQGASGMVHVDGGEVGRLGAIDQGYIAAYAYLRPHAGGAAMRFAGTHRADGTAYDVVQVTPPGGSALDLWIDEHTNLIDRITSRIGLFTTTTTYADYRTIDGVVIPFQSTTQSSTGNNSTSFVDTASINEPGASARMRMPRSNVHDFSISGGTSTSIPIEIVNNHVFLHVFLDGKGPYTFIFDTGGTYIVTPEIAAALRTGTAGGARVMGAGSKTASVQFTKIARIRIGKATIRNQNFFVLPIDRDIGIVEGVKIDGMIGYGVAARFITTVNYATRRLSLAMPGTTPPAGTAIPFFFDGMIPKLHVSIDGVAANAQLDTGNHSAFILFTPFVAAHPTIAAQATSAIGVDGFGVGGPALGRLGRIATLQIGPFVLHHVVTGFSTQRSGILADPFTSANIGGGIWKRFVLTLDYPQQRIYLEPNATYGRAFSYDRSGLFLIEAHGSVVVLDARPGTPAAAAGLRKGDVILSVDAKPATSFTLAQLRALLSGPSGTRVTMRVRSGGVEHDITLTLKDYV